MQAASEPKQGGWVEFQGQNGGGGVNGKDGGESLPTAVLNEIPLDEEMDGKAFHTHPADPPATPAVKYTSPSKQQGSGGGDGRMKSPAKLEISSHEAGGSPTKKTSSTEKGKSSASGSSNSGVVMGVGGASANGAGGMVLLPSVERDQERGIS